MQFSLREYLWIALVFALLLGWYIDRSRQTALYEDLSREHLHLYFTVHAYQNMVHRTGCDVGVELDLAQFPLGKEMAGDESQLPTIQSWPGN